MPLPPSIDKQIRDRLNYLLKQVEGPHGVDDQLYMKVKTELLSLLNFIAPNSQHFKELRNEINRWSSSADAYLIGYVRAIKSDYEAGMYNTLAEQVESNVISDYMSQAHQLLGAGIPGQFDHVPAAVLAGAVLEDALRRLCQRQNPPIPITKPNGEPKTLGTYIDDLKAVGLYNELKAKQLRAWADIRNAAAHGEFTKFKRADVETMLPGIQDFLANHL